MLSLTHTDTHTHSAQTATVKSNLLGGVQLETRAEELFQHGNVEKIAGDGVVLGYRVSELDAVVVVGPIDSLIIEEVGEILVQEIHQPLHVGGVGFWRELFLGDASRPLQRLHLLTASQRRKAVAFVLSWCGEEGGGGGGRERMKAGRATPWNGGGKA